MPPAGQDALTQKVLQLNNEGESHMQIATGVIGYTSREATALAYDDELTPELYHSSVRALASAIRTKKVSSAAKSPRT